MALLRNVILAFLLCLPILGGCTHHMAVEGRSDQLYMEAKGALESEGFRPLSASSSCLGAKGSSLAAGRLQFLYYADNIVPTVVEIQIEAAPEAAKELATSAAPRAASFGPHSIAVSAWSSLTYSPDPWISDLAVGVLRRAYLLSGNTR